MGEIVLEVNRLAINSIRIACNIHEMLHSDKHLAKSKNDTGSTGGRNRI